MKTPTIRPYRKFALTSATLKYHLRKINADVRVQKVTNQPCIRIETHSTTWKVFIHKGTYSVHKEDVRQAVFSTAHKIIQYLMSNI